MPVGVVAANRYERKPGAGGLEELLVGVVAAVVRHLEDVGPQIRAGAAQPGLGLRAEVAGEQDRQAARLGADDHRQVVGGRRRGGERGIRGEHLDGHDADRAPVTGHQRQPLATSPVDQRGEAGHPVVGRRERACGHHADLPSRQCPGQTADVVGVEVGDEDQG